MIDRATDWRATIDPLVRPFRTIGDDSRQFRNRLHFQRDDPREVERINISPDGFRDFDYRKPLVSRRFDVAELHRFADEERIGRLAKGEWRRTGEGGGGWVSRRSSSSLRNIGGGNEL